MNQLTKHFGLLPFSSRHCIRRKIIRVSAVIIAFGLVVIGSLELAKASDDLQKATEFNAVMMRGYGEAVVAKMQAEKDREVVIQDANLTCGGGK